MSFDTQKSINSSIRTDILVLREQTGGIFFVAKHDFRIQFEHNYARQNQPTESTERSKAISVTKEQSCDASRVTEVIFEKKVEDNDSQLSVKSENRNSNEVSQTVDSTGFQMIHKLVDNSDNNSKQDFDEASFDENKTEKSLIIGRRKIENRKLLSRRKKASRTAESSLITKIRHLVEKFFLTDSESDEFTDTDDSDPSKSEDWNSVAKTTNSEGKNIKMIDAEKTHEAEDSKNKLYPIFVRKSNSNGSKNESKTVVCSATANNNNSIVIDDDSDLSSEDVPLQARLKMDKTKRKSPSKITRNFSNWEQCQMVQYLIDNRCIAAAKGNRVWEHLIRDGFLKHRTPHSLNNNFRRSILPKIHRFRLKSSTIKKFRKLGK